MCNFIKLLSYHRGCIEELHSEDIQKEDTLEKKNLLDLYNSVRDNVIEMYVE